MSEKKENQRVHFRVVYPAAEAPIFKSMGHTMRVLDVSEQGVALARPERFAALKSDATLTGKIEFPDGEVTAVNGKVLRMDDKTIILLLQKPIPLAVIIQQQRWLIKKYGTLVK